MAEIFIGRLKNEIFWSDFYIFRLIGFRFHYMNDVLCQSFYKRRTPKFGLLKVHKPGILVRPVVSYELAPTYLPAKFLDRWFKSVVDFVSPYFLKNSITLVEKIKNVNPPPNSSLISFDVVGLYPHIPKAPTL